MTERPCRDCRCPKAHHVHGTYLAYLSDGCRCEPCTAAWVVKARDQRRAMQARAWEHDNRPAVFVPARLATQRLQALSVIGYGLPLIAERIGGHVSDLAAIRLGQRRYVRQSTAKRIAAVFDALWDKPQRGGKANWITARALKHGWVPPLAVDECTNEEFVYITNGQDKPCDADESPCPIDEIAVDRALHGDRVPLTKVEAAMVVARLTAMGVSAQEIGQRIGRSGRTVQRKRAA